MVVDAEVNEKQEHSSERTEKCAQKEFDGADIVRDVRLSDLSGVSHHCKVIYGDLFCWVTCGA